MAFNGRVREFVKREKWKCEHIDLFEVIETPTGKRRNRYNYQSGITKRIWDAVLKDLQKHGIPLGEIPRLLSSCGLTMTSIKKKMEGTEETHLYEMEQILLAANYSIQFGNAEREIFRVTRHYPVYQVFEELDRVIIKRNLYPKMHINFNPEKIDDFEIDFSKEKNREAIGVRKVTEFAIAGILQYFNKQNPKEIKKIEKAIRNEVKKQWLNNEIII